MLPLVVAGNAVAAGVSDCESTFDTVALLEAVSSAEGAFSALDAEGFEYAKKESERRLTCLTDRLSPAALGRFHRMQALAEFRERREARVPAALAGVIAADPGHQIPVSLLPEDHPIRAWLPAAAALLREDTPKPIPAPASGWLEVDGVFSTTAPANRAIVVQQVDAQNAVVATRYLWPGNREFSWLVGPAAPARVARTPEAAAPAPTPAKRKGSPWARRIPFMVLTVGTGAAAGWFLADANDAVLDFRQAEQGALVSSEEYREQLQGYQDRANVGASAFCILGGASAGLLLVTAISW